MIFSSGPVVDWFLAAMGRSLDVRSLSANCRLGVMDHSGRERLARAGMTSSVVSEQEAGSFVSDKRDARVVLLWEAGGEPALALKLRDLNAHVLTVPLLDCVPSRSRLYELRSGLLGGQLSAVVFCSPLAVRCVAEEFGEGMMRSLLEGPEVISVGKETGQELSRAGVLFRPWRRPGEKPAKEKLVPYEKKQDTDW
jgi:uroporphyrinogen-III synthase